MPFNRKPPPGNVRRVSSTGKNIYGAIVNKAGRTVQFESWAERALLLRLDRDPAVKDYGSQPETFEFVDGQGKTRHYTPDFIVWRDDRVEIHEVTCSQRQAAEPRLRQREIAGAEICAGRGWRYLVHTEQDLPQGSELANLLALLHFRPLIYAHRPVTEAVGVKLATGPVALAVLIRQVARQLALPEPRVMAAVGHLLWHGDLKTDLNQLIFGPTLTGIMPGVVVRQEGNNDPVNV